MDLNSFMEGLELEAEPEPSPRPRRRSSSMNSSGRGRSGSRTSLLSSNSLDDTESGSEQPSTAVPRTSGRLDGIGRPRGTPLSVECEVPVPTPEHALSPVIDPHAPRSATSRRQRATHRDRNGSMSTRNAVGGASLTGRQRRELRRTRSEPVVLALE